MLFNLRVILLLNMVLLKQTLFSVKKVTLAMVQATSQAQTLNFLVPFFDLKSNRDKALHRGRQFL